MPTVQASHFSTNANTPVIPVVPISTSDPETTLVGDSVDVFPSSTAFPVIPHTHLPSHPPAGSAGLDASGIKTTTSSTPSTTTTNEPTAPRTFAQNVTSSIPSTEELKAHGSNLVNKTSELAASAKAAATDSTREPINVPALAQSAVNSIPSAEELKAHGTALVDKTTELAAQARAQAGELVDPKPQEHQNESEAHLDNLTRGIAGMIVTAPLAGIEAISPVVADKLQAAQDAISGHLQHARDTAAPTANAYAQSAIDSVKGFTSGGNTATSTVTGTTPAVSTGPTLTEKATAALSSVAQTAHSTATAYLPESISSKLPAPPAAAISTPIQTTTNDSALASPYVPHQDDKPTTALPSENFSTIGTATGEPVALSGTSAEKFEGLARPTVV